jgi:hypothetical protein
MKLLSKKFIGKGEVSGVHFDQFFRIRDVCIYFRSGRLFEVIRVRLQQERKNINLGGVLVNFEARERYPKANEWSVHEICTHDIERALESACRLLSLSDDVTLLGGHAFDLSILPAKLRNAFLRLLGIDEGGNEN